MQLTKEQQIIVNSPLKDITVNSGPGMGKTTLLLEITKKEQNKKHLILCFNSSVKQEIQEKISKNNIKNAEVMTFHSLAFSFFKEENHIENFRNRNFNINLNYFSIYSILYKLGLVENLEDEFIPQILDFFHKYTQSKKRIIDIISKESVLYPIISKVMNYLIKNKDAPMFHELYIKIFQLMNPKVSYDVILIDEFQDVTPCYLSIIESISEGKKVVKVGDNLQKIYGYNGAIGISSFNYSLTESFRVGKENMDFCNQLVQKILDTNVYDVKGNNPNQKIVKEQKRKVVKIYRTNKNMLQEIIETAKQEKICAFSQSIFDLFQLFLELLEIEKHPVIYQGITVFSMLQLKKILKITEDSHLKLFFALAKKYKTALEENIKNVLNFSVPETVTDDYDVKFITSHRCKGMEFKHVELANDFIPFDKIQKDFLEKGDVTKLDELYILYVALTRSFGTLKLNFDLEKYKDSIC
ncbi:UvrD-helicase domain-containing protein [Fusobacterium necrophorum]|mgnify:CR=1 FL=1|uniref:UvrD-helicase domain-containing protein n=1 Tax=Fusobacterium necrophorum TaxID=859 RepID=UPI00241D8BF5|nr:UvrD-helicase domain-containing protein [Fusobacterium necrophorum]MDK4525015.1 AAA family ATPase [Fusobacterium necrophorum]